MNREIKFRGQAINGDKQWVYGGILPMYRGAVHILPTFGSFVQVDPSTVGQFTGLYDAEGREVYEGDIYQRYNYRYDVVWDDSNFRFVGRVRFRRNPAGEWEKFEDANKTTVALGWHDDETKVVGTIHGPKPEKA